MLVGCRLGAGRGVGHLAEPHFGVSVENAFFLAPFPVGTEAHPHSSAGACGDTVGSWWESCRIFSVTRVGAWGLSARTWRGDPESKVTDSKK